MTTVIERLIMYAREQISQVCDFGDASSLKLIYKIG